MARSLYWTESGGMTLAHPAFCSPNNTRESASSVGASSGGGGYDVVSDKRTSDGNGRLAPPHAQPPKSRTELNGTGTYVPEKSEEDTSVMDFHGESGDQAWCGFSKGGTLPGG